METNPARVPAQADWLVRHPLAVIGVLLAVALGPFLYQAIQTDDALFVWTARQIQAHPLDFFGGQVNWWGSTIPIWTANWNPPLWPYLLAVAGTLLGWQEVALHLAGLGMAFAAASGIYCLARRWCDRPLLATVLALVTPAFWVSSTTLMCDTTLLACTVWAVVLWERAAADGQSRWAWLAAGGMAALAMLAKYSAVSVLSLLPWLCFPRGRNFAWKLAGLAVPVVVMAGYEWMTTRMYGHGLFSLARYYARASHFDFPGGWPAKWVVGLAFAGGSLLPLWFLAPWLWRRKIVMLGALLAFAAALWFWLGGKPGLMHQWVSADSSIIKLWDFRLQVLLFVLGGLHVLCLTGAEAWQRRERITLALAWWIGSVMFFTLVLNWTMNARSFLPAVPAAAILAVRRLSARQTAGTRWLWLPLGATALVTLSLAVANWQLANAARTAATRIAEKYRAPGHTLWCDGHSGFQYYLEKLGARSLDLERSVLEPGDLVAAPLLGNFVVLPSGCVGPVNDVAVRLYSWMNLEASGRRTAAGFYTSNDGPVPFAVGAPQPREYLVVRVFCRVQFQSQPANPREVLAGAVPSFPNANYLSDDTPAVVADPAAAKQVEAAAKLLLAGNEAGAIQCCESALAIQSNNPDALSRLAWLLVSASRPELQDHRRAVQLANRAVKLTDMRQPAMIVVLATAYAADGQLAKAKFAAQMGRNLAILTGEADVAESCAKLVRQCSGR